MYPLGACAESACLKLSSHSPLTDTAASLCADNFHTLASHFSHVHPAPFNGFSQQSLHAALSQQALNQHPFSQPNALQQTADHHRSSSLPLRFSPQAGLYDPNPNSLLHALRAHGGSSQLLGLQQQPADLLQQNHTAVLPGRLTSLKQEPPEREGSDASLSGSSSCLVTRGNAAAATCAN